MFLHKITKFITMKRNRNCKKECHQFNNTRILLLSIIWTILFTETMARPNLETLLSNKPNVLEEEEQQQQKLQQQQDMFLDEIITNTNGDKLFNKLRKYHRNQANNYLNKSPNLRELVLAFDYDDNNGQEDSHEFWNSKLFERLRQLVSLKTDFYDSNDSTRYDSFESSSGMLPMKSLKSLSPANQLTFKDHNIKKNVQYMSPCHFKICNMGRKRNARLFTNY